MSDDKLPKEEAIEVIEELREEHSFDTSTDDQDEP